MKKTCTGEGIALIKPGGPVAQRLEPPAHTRLVPGSNPGGPTPSPKRAHPTGLRPCDGGPKRLHPDVEELIALSGADAEVERLEAEYRELAGAVSNAKSELESADAAQTGVEEELKSLSESERDHNRRYKTYLQRVANTERLIETGQAQDFDSATAQLANCREIVDEEETALLEIFEATEEANERLERATEFRAHRALQLENREKALAERLPSLRAEVKERRAERDTQRAAVPSHHLTRYDSLRAKGLVAVSPIRSGCCSLCNMKINAVHLAEQLRGSAVHACRTCGRFLGAEVDSI